MLEVGPVERVEPILTRLEEGRDEDAPGIVDQNVDGSEALDRGRQRGVHLVAVAHVGRHREAVDLRRRLGARVRVALPDRDLGAEDPHPVGDAPPDTGAAAGDDRDLSVEPGCRGIEDHGQNLPAEV